MPAALTYTSIDSPMPDDDERSPRGLLAGMLLACLVWVPIGVLVWWWV